MAGALPGNAYLAYSTQPRNTDFAPVCIICARYINNSDMGNYKYLLHIHLNYYIIFKVLHLPNV